MKRTRKAASLALSSNRLAALLAAALIVAACGGGAETQGDGAATGEGEPIALRFSVESTGDVLANIMNYFADNIEEELGDRVAIERFEGGTLGDEVAHMEMVRAGEVDVVPIGSDIVQLDPIYGIFDMPFLFADRDTATAFLDGPLGEQMSESLLESAGVRVLGYGETGFRHITNSVRPISTPEDLQGLRLRTPGSETRVLAFEMLGSAPTPMDINEVYLALDQGVLDGQENPLSVIDAFSFQEVQDYLSLSGHVYSPNALSINEETWQSLPADVQEVFQQAADDAVAQSREDGIENDDTLIAEFEEAGTEVNTIDLASFQEAAGPIWEAIAPTVGEDFFAEVQDWIAENA